MTETEWAAWIAVMETQLAVPLDDDRRAELALQLARMAALAGPLMAFPLPPRQEGAGVYRL